MDPLLLGLLSITVLLVLLALGMHVGIAMGLVGFFGIALVQGSFKVAIGALGSTPYAVVMTFILTALPVFLLMGLFAMHAGVTEDAYQVGYNWLGKLPGGLSIATIAACAGFGACSGSSIAAAMLFTKISLPEMRKVGYNMRFACGTTAAGGMLAMLIPPSAMLIIFGFLTETSVARLFIGGIIPGIILALMYVGAILAMVLKNPQLAPLAEISVSLKEKIVSLKRIWGLIVIMIVVFVGLYTGVFTPTEAGSVGALATFLMALALKKLNWKIVWDAISDTAQATCLIFIVIIGATIFSRFVALSGLRNTIIEGILGLGLPPLFTIPMFVFVYLVAGCFMDAISIFAITLPIMFPIAMKLGFDPIWFGIVMLMAVEIGLVTPPLGLNVYVVKAAAPDDVTLMDVFRGVFPFLLVMLTFLGLLIAFPLLITLLPNVMYGG